ncbi:hypothetical protein AVEN_106078-1 [Araneus ventricosus]|uniref:Uncharacterized protein n=1 Tax=Araneus ventricosus TaxID=182803 RepID=A0A4Y2NUX9_ARAVE|nr:hypothetical protein AVEN_106078-1 [Araneus ventricosus]
MKCHIVLPALHANCSIVKPYLKFKHPSNRTKHLQLHSCPPELFKRLRPCMQLIQKTPSKIVLNPHPKTVSASFISSFLNLGAVILIFTGDSSAFHVIPLTIARDKRTSLHPTLLQEASDDKFRTRSKYRLHGLLPSPPAFRE